MKRAIFVAALAVLAGCEGRRTLPDGKSYECIGVGDIEDAHLEYKPSARNIVLGVVFVETIFAPIIWLASDFYCPVRTK